MDPNANLQEQEWLLKSVGYRLAQLRELRVALREWLQGGGMDMGFSVVYNLSQALYGAGYKCLGKGKCPSNYHNNHRDHIKCEGTRVHNDAGTDFGSTCYRADSSSAVKLRGKYIVSAADETESVCPVCKGAGYLPNPDGPERFDLVHVDGYALRHAWL